MNTLTDATGSRKETMRIKLNQATEIAERVHSEVETESRQFASGV